MKREQFTFYRSYYEALKDLPEKERAKVLFAILDYALDEQTPNESTGICSACFKLIRPTLDSGRIKAANRETKRQQTENKTKTKRKRNRNKSARRKRERKRGSVRKRERERVSTIVVTPKPPLT